MKLAFIAVTLILLLIPGYRIVNRQGLPVAPQDTQVKNAELLNLEAQLKQLDKEADSVEVKVTGEKESSGNIKIIVERQIPGVANANDSGNANTTSANANTGEPKGGSGPTVMEKETALDIDLSKFNIPDEHINPTIKTVFTQPVMCGTIPSVSVIQVGTSADYAVYEDYIYPFPDYKIKVFKGFTYDRASIPRIFWVIIDKDKLGNVAPLLHDLLYRHGGVLPPNQISPYRKFSRKEANDLFLELLTKCGVSKVRRQLAYQAVRNFAGFAWNGN